MAVGRILCVALPFILTALSLVLLLAAALGGVANKDLYMFQVETKNLTLSPASIKNLITREPVDLLAEGKDFLDKAKDKVDNIDVDEILNEIDGKGDKAVEDLKNKVGADGTNITAADLGLGDYYNVGLWGYCTTTPAGKRECTKPTFNWAQDALNTTFIDKAASATGKQINIPDEIEDALKAFATVTKWTEVAYIIALISLAVQLLFGTFTACSRIVSCLTYIVSSISIIAVIAAASLSTAMSAVVIGAIEGTAKFYGVEGSFNTTFLGLVWASAAFAIAAGFFWLFTICCCAPDKKSRRSSKRGTDGEKLLPTSGSGYQPLHEPQMSGSSGLFSNKSQYGGPRHPEGGRSDMAYEPYSHRG